MTTCKGSSHCHSVRCERCSWRYTRKIARRISADADGPFYAVTLCIPDGSPTGFRRWRTQIRNRVHYLRQSACWMSFGPYVWLGHDGSCRGVIAGSTLSIERVRSGFTRWSLTLRAIPSSEVRLEVSNAVKPSVIYLAGPSSGRYWSRSLYVGPSRRPRQPPLDPQAEAAVDGANEPMPILIT
jgi:hypothetical protein